MSEFVLALLLSLRAVPPEPPRLVWELQRWIEDANTNPNVPQLEVNDAVPD